MKKILLFFILVMNLLGSGLYILGTDPYGEEIPMKIEKVGKTGIIRITILDGVESLNTEYVEEYNPYFVKMWYDDDPITAVVYDKHKVHTSVYNDSIVNYIVNDDLVIEIKDTIVYHFITNTKEYKHMKVEFKIQNKTVFSIYNQEGEI